MVNKEVVLSLLTNFPIIPKGQFLKTNLDFIVIREAMAYHIRVNWTYLYQTEIKNTFPILKSDNDGQTITIVI